MSQVDEEIFTLANKLITKHLSVSLKGIEPIIDKGEVNQIYKLDTSEQKLILRVNDSGEFGRFKKEEWCAALAIAHGVPGSKVLAVGQEGEFAYMLLEFIEGKNGKEIVSTPELWQELGKYLQLIHSIPAKGFGEKLEDITNDSQKKWQDYLDYNITSLSSDDILIKKGILNNQVSQSLKSLFEKLKQKDFKFGLNHGDFSLANVIIDNNSTPHIIDWGSAQAHVVPHHDLSVILDESLAEDSEEFGTLLKGYGLIQTDFESIKEEIIALQLLEAIDKLRWALDKAPKRVDHYMDQVKKLLDKSALKS